MRRIPGRSCRRPAGSSACGLSEARFGVDAGVEEGDEIGLAVRPDGREADRARGTTRDEALDRLAAALRETEVAGVTTNLPFLRWLVVAPRRARRRARRTAFLTEHPPLSAPAAAWQPTRWRAPLRLNLLAAARLAAGRRRPGARTPGSER